MQEGLRRWPVINLINLSGSGVLVALLALLALALRLLFLGQDSFWVDEAASVVRAKLSWEDFWAFMGKGPGMALYYLLLRYWILLGDQEFAVRLLSALLGAATIPLIYLLGQRLFDTRVGLLAALLLAVNAFHIQYSQEARSYTLVVFLVTLAALLLAQSVQRPWAGEKWMAYGVVGALAVYAHWFALLVLAAQLGSLVLAFRRHTPWAGILVSGTCLGLLLLPLFLIMAQNLLGQGATSNSPAPAWIGPPSLGNLSQLAADLTGRADSLLLTLYLVLVLLGVYEGAVWARRLPSISSSPEPARVPSRGWAYLLVLLWLLFPIALTLGYSLLVAPALVSRYLLVCLPPLTLLAALGIWRIGAPLEKRARPRGPWLAALLALVLVAGLVGLSGRQVLAYYQGFVKEDWRGAAQWVAAHWQPGDGVLFYMPWTQNAFGHYFEESSVAGVGALRPVISTRRLNRLIEEGPGAGSGEARMDAIARELPEGYERIWLVLSHPQSAQVSRDIRAALRSKYPGTETTPPFPGLHLALFTREDPSARARVNLPTSPLPRTASGCPLVQEDASGHANHGRLTNPALGVPSPAGGALAFDGRTDLIIGPVHGFLGTAPFSVALWARDDGGRGVYSRLISKEKGQGAREGWVVFQYKSGSSYGFERWEEGEQDRIVLPYQSGYWNHIAFTFDGAYMKGYLNGVLAVVDFPEEGPKEVQPTSGPPLVIGARSDDRTDFYRGELDEVRIYDRALTTAEVEKLVTDPAGPPGPGLVAYWPLDVAEAGADCTSAAR